MRVWCRQKVSFPSFERLAAATGASNICPLFYEPLSTVWMIWTFSTIWFLVVVILHLNVIEFCLDTVLSNLFYLLFLILSHYNYSVSRIHPDPSATLGSRCKNWKVRWPMFLVFIKVYLLPLQVYLQSGERWDQKADPLTLALMEQRTVKAATYFLHCMTNADERLFGLYSGPIFYFHFSPLSSTSKGGMQLHCSLKNVVYVLLYIAL